MNSKGAAELSLLKAHWTLASEKNTEQKNNHFQRIKLICKKLNIHLNTVSAINCWLWITKTLLCTTWNKAYLQYIWFTGLGLGLFTVLFTKHYLQKNSDKISDEIAHFASRGTAQWDGC